MEEYRTEVIPSVQETSDRSSLLHFIVDVIETLILSVILFLGINAVSARIRVDGSSMEPTLHNGEFVIVNKLAFKFSSPRLGDIIVFHYPRDPQQEYIKRVIGIPGDKVDILDGQVYINDQLIQEPYIADSPAYGPGSWVVPQGSLFVLGDNRNNSSDSHTWGSVPLDYVVGKAVFVYWPPTQWGAVQHSVIAAP